MQLLIYNNTSRFSTVLDAFLKEAQYSFERIYVIFPKQFNAEENYDRYKNVVFVTPKIKNYIKAGLISSLDVFQKDSFSDYLLAIKKRKLGLGFIKTYIRSLFRANILYATSICVVKKAFEDIVIFSTWYDINAIATAKMAKRYPDVFTASYAHSYEVDFRKNAFTAIIRDRFKEKYINEIYFISENVMNEYIALNNDVLLHTNKYKSIHFGSKKMQGVLASYSSDDVFRVVTCSGISPVKRLDILAKALVLYKGEKRIEWTVIGEGIDKEKIKFISKMNDQDKVSIIFKGSLSNKSVHDYYVKNPVDLFVNISSSEGLPVSIMEAMSYGIPVLATDVGGNHEIVTTENGYPIPADITPGDLCEKITSIVCDSDDLKKKRATAFDMWDKNYRLDRNVDIVIERLKNGKRLLAKK